MSSRTSRSSASYLIERKVHQRLSVGIARSRVSRIMRSAELVVMSLGVAGAYDCCWCDKATPKDAYTITHNKQSMQLIFSDEFNSNDRNFVNGHDTKWTALEVGDTSNQGSAFYLPEQARPIASGPCSAATRHRWTVRLWAGVHWC
jgi:hypothetical protein